MCEFADYVVLLDTYYLRCNRKRLRIDDAIRLQTTQSPWRLGILVGNQAYYVR